MRIEDSIAAGKNLVELRKQNRNQNCSTLFPVDDRIIFRTTVHFSKLPNPLTFQERIFDFLYNIETIKPFFSTAPNRRTLTQNPNPIHLLNPDRNLSNALLGLLQCFGAAPHETDLLLSPLLGRCY